MSTEPETAAVPAAIVQAILDLLAETARFHAAHGEKGSDLRDAPKQLLCLDLAKGLARSFGGLRYRLQAPPDESARSRRIGADARGAPEEDPARFDVVLLDEASAAPRYVVEVQHGTAILDDVLRAMRIAARGGGQSYWQDAFLVTILRRSERQAIRIAEKLVAEIEDPATRESAGLAPNAPLAVTHRLQQVGESKSRDGTAIFAVVFGLSFGAAAAPGGTAG